MIPKTNILFISILLLLNQVLAQQLNSTVAITNLVSSFPSFSAFSAAVGSANASSIIIDTVISSTIGCQNANLNSVQYIQTVLNYANQRRSSLPPTLLLPICSSTCEASQSSINSIINNPRSCQTPTSEQKRIRDLVQSELLLTCALSQSTVCFNGTTLERQSCGFSGPNALETAQLFCLNNSDSCCISLNSFPISTPQPTSGSRSMDAVAYVVDWTVIIAIVVGILLLILLCILGFAICIKRKNKNNEQQLPQHVIMPLSTQDGTYKRQLYRVRHSYQADMSDEMNLEIDHQVLIDTHFPDGWAEGKNLTTGQVGMLPFSCLEETEAESKVGMRTSSVSHENQAKNFDAEDEITTRRE